VPATEIAMKHVGRAVPNVPLLALRAVSGQIRIESVVAAIAKGSTGARAKERRRGDRSLCARPINQETAGA
jgi:pyruvate ferredoxin oxidoreductase gamma subunit